MLHVFSTNLVKFVARTPTATIKKEQREYILNLLVIQQYFSLDFSDKQTTLNNSKMAAHS